MSFLPKQLLVFLISGLPLLEVQAGIPLGYFLGMSYEAAFFWSVLGTMCAVMIVLKVLGPISDWLMKHSKFFHKFFTKIFETTRKKHSTKFNDIGAIFLIGYVAVPLPGAGAWSGALIAFLFGIPYWKAIGLIFAGNLIAATLVIAGVGSVVEVSKFIFPHP